MTAQPKNVRRPTGHFPVRQMSSPCLTKRPVVTLKELQRSTAQMGESVDRTTISHALKAKPYVWREINTAHHPDHTTELMGIWMEPNTGQSWKKTS